MPAATTPEPVRPSWRYRPAPEGCDHGVGIAGPGVEEASLRTRREARRCRRRRREDGRCRRRRADRGRRLAPPEGEAVERGLQQVGEGEAARVGEVEAVPCEPVVVAGAVAVPVEHLQRGVQRRLGRQLLVVLPEHLRDGDGLLGTLDDVGAVREPHDVGDALAGGLGHDHLDGVADLPVVVARHDHDGIHAGVGPDDARGVGDRLAAGDDETPAAARVEGQVVAGPDDRLGGGAHAPHRRVAHHEHRATAGRGDGHR